MKKRVLVLFIAMCLSIPPVCLADEQSDAEAAISEAESMLENMNSMGLWIGPARTMKMEAEKHLEMAKESFEAGEYAEAINHAEMAMDYAQKAIGLRLWYMLTRPGSTGLTVPQSVC